MCTEHEFSCANDHRAGANPFDVLESFDHVESLANQCDYVIVLYHGGKEFYQYPSPMLQRYCRKFIEKGATLVLCQHSHCIGSREDYKTGTIIYGQGNFVFHTSAFDELYAIVDNSLLIDVEIDDTDFYVSEIPLVPTEMGVKLASPEASELILNAYKERSEKCKDYSFLMENYKEFADTHIQRYLREFLGRTWIVKIINGLTRRKLVRLLLGKTSYLGIQNFIECEAHHELFLQGLKNINRK